MRNSPERGPRRWIDWAFRDRRTGAIVVGQRPNPPLWLFLVLAGLAWAAEASGVAGAGWLRAASYLALAWWGADEVARGVNPWRRFLGAATLAGLALLVVVRHVP